MDHKTIARQILEAIGGEKNVTYLTHCATRLRFDLKEPSIAETDKIKQIDGVVGVVNQGGQYQVIIGNDVKYVYQALQEITNSKSVNNSGHMSDQHKSAVEKVLDTISGIFVPIVPALAGSGMLKALLSILALLGWLDIAGSTYQILYFVSDAIFYFLPMLLAHSASVKFKTNPYLSITIGGILLHPTFVTMIKTAQETGDPLQLFNLPVTLVNYGSSVIPILLAIWCMSYIEPFIDRYVPKVTRIFMTPMLTLLVMAPLTLIVLGPLGTFLGDGLASGIEWLNGYAGWLIPTVVGTFTPLLVMTGMHYALISIGINSLAKAGFDTVAGPGMLVSNIAQGAAALAVAVRTKNGKLRSLGVSTGISAVLGITEPALYGVNLPYRKPLISAMIGGGLGGLFLGIMGVGRYQQVPPGLLALPSFLGEEGLSNLIYTIIGLVIAFIGAFIAQLILGIEDQSAVIQEEAASLEGEKTFTGIQLVKSPLSGQLIPLSEVKDDVFAKELLGQGVAIVPEDGEVVAPIDGTITVLFETKHAIGIKGDNGIEILIHCGLETVSLDGEGFETFVSQGDHVKQGQKLVKMDLALILSKGLDITTPVIVTNSPTYQVIQPLQAAKISKGQELLEISEQEEEIL